MLQAASSAQVDGLSRRCPSAAIRWRRRGRR